MSYTVEEVDAEAQRLVRAAAEPWQPGDSIKAGIGRAARALGLGYRRAQQAWYRQPAAWRAAELDAMRARHRDVLMRRQDRLRAELATLAVLIGGEAL